MSKSIRSKVSGKLGLYAFIVLLVLSGIYFVTQNNSNKLQGQISKTTNFKETGFSLDINRLNIKAPVITGVDPTNEEAYNQALTGGVAHMNSTSLPGEGSNIFIYGHSSAEIKSDYQKIFANLNLLNKTDKITLNYKAKVYNYIIVDKIIVEEDDFSVLDKTDHEQLSLMTCWPIGTNDKRLVIVADLQN